MHTHIKVTNLDTGKTEIYEYRADNWRGVGACMRNGAVHMWAPKELNQSRGFAVITSGYRWELINAPTT